MKTLKRGVKRGACAFAKIFNLLVILGLVFQPMGQTGMYSIARARESESDTESAAGSIRVCKMIVDADGNVVDGSALPGSTFTISGFTPDPATSEGVPVGVLPISTFTTEDLLNARILNISTENDARCISYNDLGLGNYYYEEETIPSSDWENPKYNDQFTTPVLEVSDFFQYDGNLFDGDGSDDGSRDTNVDGHIVLNADRPDRTLVVLNQYKLIVPPTLEISKSNDSGSPENPGNDVIYTITVTAPESNTTDVEDVVVTDLPPEGFEFVSGSDTASQGSLTSAYASPGVWSLGTMTPGQVITLQYKVKISDIQDAGLYNDLAFARGTSEADDPVIANASESTPFVGTDVDVVLPVAPVEVALTNIVERDVDTKTIHKTKRVLGAAVLPFTGANINTVLFALLMLLGGLILILLGKRSTWNLIRNLSKSMMKVFLFVIVAGSILLVNQSANAASGDLNVKIEQPKAVINSPEIKVGFVVLDISADDPIDVECEVAYEAGPFGEFDTYTIAAGGTSGNCDVNAVDMPADGTYTFRVTAEEQEGSDSDVATAVSIELVSGTPSTPLDYSRADGSCTASFTTANDGLTDKVELYRSLSSTFTADGSTLAAVSASIGPNVAGTLTDASGDCGGSYFYAIRAIALSGLGSGFVGDEKVVVDHENKIKTETDTKKVAGPVTTLGAIPVTGETAPSGAGEGATTEETEETVQPSAEQEGSVLGSATEAAGAAAGGIVDWIKNHPWWSSLWLLIIILIAYFARRIYFGNYDENNPQ